YLASALPFVSPGLCGKVPSIVTSSAVEPRSGAVQKFPRKGQSGNGPSGPRDLSGEGFVQAREVSLIVNDRAGHRYWGQMAESLCQPQRVHTWRTALVGIALTARGIPKERNSDYIDAHVHVWTRIMRQ